MPTFQNYDIMLISIITTACDDLKIIYIN